MLCVGGASETEKVFIHDKKIRSGVKVLDGESGLCQGMDCQLRVLTVVAMADEDDKDMKKDSKNGM